MKGPKRSAPLLKIHSHSTWIDYSSSANLCIGRGRAGLLSFAPFLTRKFVGLELSFGIVPMLASQHSYQLSRVCALSHRRPALVDVSPNVAKSLLHRFNFAVGDGLIYILPVVALISSSSPWCPVDAGPRFYANALIKNPRRALGQPTTGYASERRIRTPAP
jgi:hypothetical protein